MHRKLWFSVAALAVGTSLLVAAGFASPASSSPTKDSSENRRGGTLRVDQRSDFDFIDPSLAYFSHSWQGNFWADCKLLNFPDKEAAAGGLRIIPEVAAALPAVSKNGKVYTFTLKKTYKFSNGSQVTAANFKYAFDRNSNKKMSSPATTFMEDIVGEKAANAGNGKVSGVKVLSKFKLRITLTKVAPDFLARVTMPFFAAIPLNTPINAEGVGAPRASCGPYYYASWDKGRQLVMERNKFYKGPRPANPDRIVENIGIALDAQRLRLERGDTDIGGFPPAQAAELRDKYGVNKGRFFVKGQAVFWYLNFNHDQPLFKGNDKLKRAVNHAMDRPQMVRQHGALGGARTDQILPIDFPGFRNWSIYSLAGSNVAKAKSEAQGATRSGKVRFWTFNASFGPPVAQVIQFNLKQIGLDTDITALDRVVQTTKGGTKGAEFDMLLNGWGEDYPDPYDFINILLSGTSIQPDNNVNLSYFNSPVWNKRMEAASRQFGAKRLRAYAILDRDLMKGPAPMAPYINTNARILVSDRVKGFVFHKVYGSDFGAISVQ
ncbi:MAG: ABC transporter substrate-binding protein [Actinomycetota bacterium]|nr:ABC transporter substrate-binding protein [Actinomycetota bacterium]